MKKLKLVAGDLRVESFPTRPADDGADRGTVQAHEWVLTPRCVYTDPAETCWCTERGCP
jgi:hypothetical protein